MKYITLVLGLLLVVICTHLPANSSIVNIDGTWSGVYDASKYGQPPKHLIFNFKSDEGSLTGTACDATARPDEWIELKNIKLEDNKIYFTAEPVQGMVFKYEGKIEGDKIDLTLSFSAKVNLSTNGPTGTASMKEQVVTDNFTIKREK